MTIPPLKVESIPGTPHPEIIDGAALALALSECVPPTAATDGPSIVIRGGDIGSIEAYCQDSRCDARYFAMLVKPLDGDFAITPRTLFCPLCGGHTAAWARYWARETGVGLPLGV